MKFRISRLGTSRDGLTKVKLILNVRNILFCFVEILEKCAGPHFPIPTNTINGVLKNPTPGPDLGLGPGPNGDNMLIFCNISADKRCITQLRLIYEGFAPRSLGATLLARKKKTLAGVETTLYVLRGVENANNF